MRQKQQTRIKPLNTSWKLYISFLTDEMPSVIQIVTLPAIFSFFVSKSLIFQLVIAFTTYQLLLNYLYRRQSVFLKNQITDQYSDINRHALDENKVAQDWHRYSLGISAAAALLISSVAAGIHLN